MTDSKTEIRYVEKFLHWSENVIYIVIAIFLVVTAALLVITLLFEFIHNLAQHNVIEIAVIIIDRLLLILMVLEILYTVRVSLREHSLVCEPFLIVGLIASVRRILVLSVETAHLAEIIPEEFNKAILELGVLGILILVFTVSIVLIRSKKGISGTGNSCQPR